MHYGLLSRLQKLKCSGANSLEYYSVEDNFIHNIINIRFKAANGNKCLNGGAAANRFKATDIARANAIDFYFF